MRRLPMIFAIFAMAATSPALAEDAAPVCVKAGVLPAELAGWDKPAKGAFALDVRTDVALTPDVTFPVSTGKPPKPGSFGGALTLAVATAGTYRVALGAPVWIDVVKDGKALSSSAHGHGPLCTGVRKIVDFVLTPGRYTLQLSGSATPKAAVMVVRLP